MSRIQSNFRLQKFALLCGAILVPVFYLPARIAFPGGTDPINLRFFISGILLLQFIASLKLDYVKYRMDQLMNISIVCLTLWGLYLFYINRFEDIYIVSLIMTIMVSSLLINKPKTLLYYNSFVAISLIILLLFEGYLSGNAIQLVYPFLSVLSIILFSFFCFSNYLKFKLELIEKNKILDAIYNNADVGIASIDFNGKIIDVNQTFANMLGYTRVELNDMTVRDISHEDDANKSMDFIQQLGEANGKPVRIEKRHRTKSGEFINTSVSQKVIYDSSGNPERLLGVITDITHQSNIEKELITNQKKFRDIFDTLTDCYINTSLSGEITVVSPAIEDLLGYTVEEITGKNFKDLYANSNDREVLLKLIKEKEQVKNHKLELLNKQNRPVIIEANIRIKKNDIGEYDGLEGVLRDVRDRIKMEEQIVESEKKI